MEETIKQQASEKGNWVYVPFAIVIALALFTKLISLVVGILALGALYELLLRASGKNSLPS